MALRALLTTAERGQILAIPTGTEDLAARYTLSDADMSLIRQRRGEANRLGFTVQLALLRYPGIALAEDTEMPPELVSWLASRIAVSSEWGEYGTREETRQEHGREIRAYLGMSAFGIAEFEPARRYATLFAMAVESMATVTDEIIELHDRIIGRLIRTAQNKHNQATLASRSTVTAMMRLHSRLGDALFAAKENGEDPFAAIETAIGWESLATSIAQAKEMTRPTFEDHLALVSAHFTTLRRYTPAFLAVLDLHAAPAAQNLLAAINVLRALNTTGARKIPDDAPVSFIRPRWKPLVFTDDGFHRGFYEFCALTELKNALRSGDMWVTGSRQFRDFDDYLLARPNYTVMKTGREAASGHDRRRRTLSPGPPGPAQRTAAPGQQACVPRRTARGTDHGQGRESHPARDDCPRARPTTDRPGKRHVPADQDHRPADGS